MPGPGEVLGHDRVEQAGGDAALDDDAAEPRPAATALVVVQRVPVAGDLGEQLDVAPGDGAGPPGGVADVHAPQHAPRPAGELGDTVERPWRRRRPPRTPPTCPGRRAAPARPGARTRGRTRRPGRSPSATPTRSPARPGPASRPAMWTPIPDTASPRRSISAVWTPARTRACGASARGGRRPPARRGRVRRTGRRGRRPRSARARPGGPRRSGGRRRRGVRAGDVAGDASDGGQEPVRRRGRRALAETNSSTASRIGPVSPLNR